MQKLRMFDLAGMEPSIVQNPAAMATESTLLRVGWEE
jgi:hypothetical protein